MRDEGVNVWVLKIGEIRELIRLLDETSIHELKIETDTMKVLMKKADATTVAVPASVENSSTRSTVVYAEPKTPESQPVPSAPVPVSQSDTKPTQENAGEQEGHFIRSPMVGTFYRAPAPESPPFVEKGSKVDPKTVVCIVEAMKLMNEIEADVKGEIIEILAENGQLVEYGQPLFRVRLV